MRLAVYFAIALLLGVGLWVGAANLLFTVTVALSCDVEGPAGFVGCTGIERGAWQSWLVSLVAVGLVGAGLVAVARGWLRERPVGLLGVAVASVVVSALLFGSVDAFVAVEAMCHPDADGGCLPYAVPGETMAMAALVGAVLALVVGSAAVAAGRSRPLN
ncbi:hypothetical protein [Demequina sediminicola]|uniref:hypothetical protein n=1 Tax=Demequina sediminicola TaxID=1095026 RepID=UPI0007843514|nr:hypothetical protein [Demequina sediminicola]